jgi:penicillin-binding protein 1A
MLRKVLIGAAAAAAVLALALVGFIGFAVKGLPNYEELAKYEPPITTRVYAGDGTLIAEFAREQRVFVPSEAIPDRVKNAFLSAEDKGFYEHGGIDLQGLARATAVNIVSIFTGDRMQGASTITQQVAKNMLLTSDRTITRKVKEAFLAQRIEKAFTKDRILELYLNEIYLGQRAYGVAAATLNYFNKPLDELTIAQAAYLGALPKGPANYNPMKHKERAVGRRNWVIDRMAENGFISDEEAVAAKKEALVVTDRLQGAQFVVSAHFVEELRRTVAAQYGEKKLYDDGLSIRSTLDPRLQVAAARALRMGLDQYDRRRGWRGPLDRFDLEEDVLAGLRQISSKAGADAPTSFSALDKDLGKRIDKITGAPGASGWRKGIVVAIAAKKVTVVYQVDQTTTFPGALRRGELAPEDVDWVAQGAKRDKKRALQVGTVIYAQEMKPGKLALRQVPEVEGALLAMDAQTGRVLAMVGGYAFDQSQYNRATQAKRQPGSAFKPFVYAAALDSGLTPATLVEDAPFALKQADGTMWNPENYTKEFYGATTLRAGLEKSRNLMTIRLAYEMGMDRVFKYGKDLSIYAPEGLPKCDTAEACSGFLSYALGAGETTLWRMVKGYATFVNGGRQVEPTLIDRVQDRNGKTVYKHDQRACATCSGPWAGGTPPDLPDTRPQILDPLTAYQVTSMLEGVVERGTGVVIKTVGKPLAGKTGTTNDYKDAWFVGFSSASQPDGKVQNRDALPDLVVGVWVGFDKPKSMGEGESGSRLAAPIFRDFMAEALDGIAATDFRRPSGVRLVRIDAQTGLLPGPGTTAILEEAFRPDTEPVRDGAAPLVFGQNSAMNPNGLGDLAGLITSDDSGAALGPDGTPLEPGQAGPVGAPVRSQQPPNAVDGIY